MIVATRVLVFTSHVVEEEPRFSVRCHPVAVRPFVVLALGDDATTLHLYEPAYLVALGQAVAEAHDLLTAALAGQDPLPVEQTALA